MLFDYYDVIVDDTITKTITAKVRNVRVNPQSKALSEGVAANAAFVNMGADAVAGAGMVSALAATANNAPAGTTTLAPFGTMQAGQSRIETGSHVDVTGLNIIAGIALGQQTEFGKLLIGPFFEAGFGSYNTYNSFDNASNLHFNADKYQFYSGAGGWSAYVAYGPFYVATIEIVDEDGNVLQPATKQIVPEGYVPSVVYRTLVSGGAVTADGEYTFVFIAVR